MSSAAVQHNTPQQYTDRYGVHASTALSSSPPSSRRTTRQGNGNGSMSNTPQQAHYASPSSSSTAAMTTPRGQGMSPASQASPSEPLSSSTIQQFYPDSASPGPAIALPIRTSSQQAPTTATATAYGARPYGIMPQQPDSGYDERDRGQSEQKSTPDSSRGQRSRQAPTQSRSATAVGQPPVDTSLPRENSAIINRIVVDDPTADILREDARIAESRPNQPGSTMPQMVDQTIPANPEQKQRSRQEHLKQQQPQRKEVKFGDYILGQTLGEGEFGKVKMGWKKDSSVQVAIKLIRKESLQNNANRLPKIYREIAILRELQHPNIVRLHEFVETERHMGIILEYASGGELFDYILNHRYLKDPQARRLFAQLVSGVGYLHKKGIVHRDLKLENLLLDRNKNIIITDFGFANTFNPNDELGEEIEHKIMDKEFVKRERLGEQNVDGMRRGDLMQTSCGSPCYAAPELVVSDGLYTGRKVDVWSCGVILYAMLAGYLPFDDDPANPEGDNINLLYKYITSTPLTFPEYVTPHARDLLRRILVPDPRRRADLFEVARHSWLSEYSHVVGFIGSSTKSDLDIAASAMRQDEGVPALGRSASVREPASKAPASADGVPKQPIRTENAAAQAQATSRDAKRRTVQLEYVAPRETTARGESSPASGVLASPAINSSNGKTRARGDASGPVEVTPSQRREPQVVRKEVSPAQTMAPPSRPGRDPARAASDNPAYIGQAVSASRPNTSGTLGSPRLPSRGNSYSTPAVATPTNANAQAQLSQPKSSSGYIISGPINPDQQERNRPASHSLAQYQQQQQQPMQEDQQRAHKRSSTLSSIGDRIMGRSASRRVSQQSGNSPFGGEKKVRKYPPISMRNAIPYGEDAQPRPSTESSRRPSFGFSRKASGETPPENKRSSRRFSFLPSSFSMNNFTGGSKTSDSRPGSKGAVLGPPGSSRTPSESTNSMPYSYDQQRRTGSMQQAPQSASGYDKALPQTPSHNYSSGGTSHPASAQTNRAFQDPPTITRKQYRDDGYGGNALDAMPQQQQQDPVGGERFYTPNAADGSIGQSPPSSQPQFTNYYDAVRPSQPSYADNYQAPEPTASFRPNQRSFAEQYERGNSGSSSAGRRVMDFFRRRGKDRSEG